MHRGGRVACIVVAAGSGTRLGAGAPKAFVEVAGTTLLDRAVQGVRGSRAVAEIVLVVPADRVAEVAATTGREDDVVVVAGGATRQWSVHAGLGAVGAAVDVVLVHDAARALTPPGTFADVVRAVRSGSDVVVPAVELHDTVRALRPDGGGSALVDRSTLRAVQTPQGFRRDVLDRVHALAAGAGAATDDATLAEQAGHAVTLVPGSPEAFKVTRPPDLLLAGALVAAGAVAGTAARPAAGGRA